MSDRLITGFGLGLDYFSLVPILEFELLRHLLANDVLVDLLHHLLRNFLQLAVDFIHILPEILLHHPLQLVHFEVHLFGRVCFRSQFMGLAGIDGFSFVLLVQFQLLLDEHREFFFFEEFLLVLQ